MSLEKEIKQKINSPQHEALLNVLHTANYMDRVSQKFFARFGNTEAQYNVMVVIRIEGRCLTQVEISERIVSSRANITALLDKLQAKGYIRRIDIEGDRRAYGIELTTEGKKLLAVVEEKYVRGVKKIMSGFSVQESRSRSSALEKLRRGLSALKEEDYEA